MSVRSAERTLQNLLQLVLDEIETGNPSLISQITTQIELLKGIIRELPIQAVFKTDILNRLDQAQALVQAGGSVSRFSTVLQILQVVTLKIQNLEFTVC
ncbi:MAG TPA: hypothetical protein VHY08_00100 [Bacillota bacterium]|nr:hypothetical protein [Bacillota bacterium]